MSYLVLARKYRPRRFSDVVGQVHVIRPLSNALASGRTAHAYLFSGARGVGKTTAARLLSMALNCLAEPGQRPCGECSSCLEIIEGQAVDVFEIDGASNRGINEIRDLRETIKYLPSKGRYKVYIIDEVHMLTKEAFNALLKTLEEPPDHVVFIFATTESHKVLPTILSRCQRYDFKRINVGDIVARLKDVAASEGIEAEEGALRVLARESEGGLRDALSLFDQVIAYCGLKIRTEDVAAALGLIDQTLIADLAKALLAGDAGTGLDILANAYNYGFDAREFALRVLEFFRGLVVTKVSREPGKILDLVDAELLLLKEIAGQESLETINYHFNAWLEVQGRLHRASQPRLILEALIVRLAQVGRIKPLAELAARLEAFLEKGGVLPPPAGGGHGPVGAPPAGSGGWNRPTPSGSPSTSFAPGPVKSAPPEPAVPARPPARPDPTPSPTPTWEAFTGRVREESPMMAPIVARSQVRAFGPAKVELAFGAKGDLNLLDQNKLLGLLSDFFGARPELRVYHEEGASGSTAAGEWEKTRKEILEHPMVKEAQQIFSGQVTEVLPEREII
ncbi:MAG: DNA polymerase III subunit gamma/tau [Pseudomonadota bacterium]